MKFKLINTKTNKEAICDKITIEGFDYYVSDGVITDEGFYISWETNYATEPKERYVLYVKSTGLNGNNPRKVIATNNQNIDIPKVVDEVVSFEGAKDLSSFVRGYNKAKETFQFTEEDMIEFAWWLKENIGMYSCDRIAHFEGRYFQTWKEQQPKTLYYNE